MMKTVVRCLFVLLAVVLVAAPAYSDPQAKPAAPAQAAAAPAHSAAPAKMRDVVHIYQCNIVGDKVTEAEVEADVLEMLKATRATTGGEKFTAKVLWPVAVTNLGETDFHVVVTYPTFTAWGKVWDASRNPESPLAKWEASVKRFDQYDCPESALWESVTIDEK
jgi:hypothetical protein